MLKILFILLIIALPVYFLFGQSVFKEISKTDLKINTPSIPPIIPTPTPTPLPRSKILPGSAHVFQSFNNCGPAALSMALSLYGINVTQQELGQALRPYQVPSGDNDDKSVTLEELAEKSKEYGFLSYHRPNGNIDLVKKFIANDIPVITRTLLHDNEDIGHYRVIKGYDDNTGELIQDDSLQGKDLRYTYDNYNSLWKQFNYEYLVLIPQEKKLIAEEILGEDVNEKVAWEKAVENSRNQLRGNPNDVNARFNLSVALYQTGDFKESVGEFEKIENQLTFRTLWYQIEPIEAYYELGNYQKVFEITDEILNNHNRAFSELYLIRGNIYKNQGNLEEARNEYEKAVQYNTSSQKFKDALNS